jgi:hypothetical protein
MRNTNRIVSFLVVTLLVAAVSGCSQKETAATAPAPATPQQSAMPAAVPPAAAPAAAPASPPANAPLASTDGDIPGIRISIDGLKRTSDTLTLKFTVYNSSGKGFGLNGAFDNDPYHRYGDLRGVYLLDPVGKKKYFVVQDTDGSFLSSSQMPDVATGSQASLWAKFPAPPDDVTKMTVAIPHFIPLEDIPIGR